jgi:methylated-DNA-[protein]-cysteine S-methyltransferase
MRANLKSTKLKTPKTYGSKSNGENIMNCYTIIESPVGELMLVADASALIGLYFVGCGHVPPESHQWHGDAQHSVLSLAADQLHEYFTTERTDFSVPVRLTGTAFQNDIWREIGLVPYGATVSYTELARRAGAPQAIRAAGTTTAQNPVSIIIPCHRVVGKNGSLCGFAGGLERKRHLLEMESQGFSRAKRRGASGSFGQHPVQVAML